MGTEGVWIPLVLSALGAGASAVNTKQVHDRQQDVAAQGIAAQTLRQRDADERVNREINAQARSSPEAEREQSLADFTSALTTAKTKGAGTTDVPMGTDRYQTDTTAAKAGIQNYGDQLADIQSRLNAPMLQRERENVSRRRTGSDVMGIGRNAEGDAWLNQLLRESIRPDTGLSIFGDVASGAGTALAGSAGSIPSSAETAAGVQGSMNEVMRKLRTTRRPVARFG